MTVREMSSKMTEQEFYGWQLYDSYEPLNADEFQLARIAAVLINVNGGEATMKDYMISQSITDTSQELSGEDLNTYLKGVF